MQRFGWSARLVPKLEVRMERGEVERNVGTEVESGSSRQACGFRPGSSLSVGIIRLVISNQTLVSFLSH